MVIYQLNIKIDNKYIGVTYDETQAVIWAQMFL